MTLPGSGNRGHTVLNYPKRSAILDQRLPEYEQGHDCCQHKRCEPHLNERETRCVFAKKPSCNDAAYSQELIGGPREPINLDRSPAPCSSPDTIPLASDLLFSYR
jgi:hypothetical protein